MALESKLAESVRRAKQATNSPRVAAVDPEYTGTGQTNRSMGGLSHRAGSADGSPGADDPQKQSRPKDGSESRRERRAQSPTEAEKLGRRLKMQTSCEHGRVAAKPGVRGNLKALTASPGTGAAAGGTWVSTRAVRAGGKQGQTTQLGETRNRLAKPVNFPRGKTWPKEKHGLWRLRIY